ncbi:MAG TPA: hypothetical protein VGM24_08130, partial [Puia sp.]
IKKEEVMKSIFLIGLIILAEACSPTQPMTVTANPDPTTSSSGATGSAKFTDQMPRKSTDTESHPTDTARIRRDSVPK